jgi:AraC-like DNA-binding protein
MVAAALTLQAAPREAGAPLFPALATSLAQLLECARSELDGDQEAARASIARASALLRVELDRQASTANDDVVSGRLATWQVRRLKTFIEDRLDQTIHIRDLAEVAQRSVAYFCRAFKRTFGETPHAYIVSRRLERARLLMLTTDMALSAVALSCGFADQAHLCNLFRQSDGQSPAAWRRQQREILVGPVPVDPIVGPRSGAVERGLVVEGRHLEHTLRPWGGLPPPPPARTDNGRKATLP